MRHTISVLVENKFGVLARISTLFAARGFNIDSLAVGKDYEDPTSGRHNRGINNKDRTQMIKNICFGIFFVVLIISLSVHFTEGTDIDGAQTTQVGDSTSTRVTDKQISEDDLKDWNSYKKYGFEIKYPKNYYFDEADTEADHSNYDSYGGLFCMIFNDIKMKGQSHDNPARISIIKTDLSPEEWVKKHYTYMFDPNDHSDEPHPVYNNLGNIQINGINATKYRLQKCSGSSESILFKRDPQTLFVIEALADGWGEFPRDIFNEMLSSFKFVDLNMRFNEQEDYEAFRNEHEIYRNEKYGFEIKYLKQYFLKEDVEPLPDGSEFSVSFYTHLTKGKWHSSPVRIEVIKTNLSAGNWVVKNYLEGYGRFNYLIIDHKKALRCFLASKSFSSDSVLVKKDAKTLFVIKYVSDPSATWIFPKNEFEKMILTFKFIDIKPGE